MTLIFWNAYGNGAVGASDDVAWDHALSLLSLYVSHGKRALFFSLLSQKTKKQKNKFKTNNNNAWSQVGYDVIQNFAFVLFFSVFHNNFTQTMHFLIRQLSMSRVL